ncbi:MAG TPA: YceI family protein [Puia sp.]|nr:YceI family protein [Puia sp.]
MKRFFLLFLISMITKAGLAQYQATDVGSTVQFKIKNFGLSVSGSFSGLKGSIQFDPQKLPESTFSVTVDANTVNTGIDMRDEHLRAESYFDVKQFPGIRLVSTKITGSNKKDVFFFFGNLTVKNQTKAISFPFTAESANGGYLFKGSFKINRKDFDVGGSSTISNELEVLLNVLAKRNEN